MVALVPGKRWSDLANQNGTSYARDQCCHLQADGALLRRKVPDFVEPNFRFQLGKTFSGQGCSSKLDFLPTGIFFTDFYFPIPFLLKTGFESLESFRN